MCKNKQFLIQQWPYSAGICNWRQKYCEQKTVKTVIYSIKMVYKFVFRLDENFKYSAQCITMWRKTLRMI
jgi:hypothetical protein